MTQTKPQGKSVSHENMATNQNITPSLPPSEAGSFDVGSGEAKSGEYVASTVFSELTSPDFPIPPQVIPAELVGMHVITLPMRSKHQQRAALPFAVEDRLGQSVEDVHMVLCGPAGTSGDVLAAVLSSDLMSLATQSDPARAVVPEQMLLAAPAPQETGPVSWRCYRKADRVLVRVSDGTGFAVRLAMLATLWQIAGKPAVESFGERLPDEIRSTHQETDPPRASPAEVTDLRQGVFRPDLGLGRPIKWLAAACLVAAVAHLGLAMADLRAQKGLADSLRATAQSALAERLPDTTTETAPSLVQRKLAAQTQPQRGSEFLPLLNRVSGALLGQSEAVQVRQLSWSGDTLRLSLEAPDLDALQRAEARLVTDGLVVSSGSATAEAGAARADLTVRP